MGKDSGESTIKEECTRGACRSEGVLGQTIVNRERVRRARTSKKVSRGTLRNAVRP